jgi:hypothetical protein
MPRSHYIYLVRYNACGTVLGAFTVKREAEEWALRESGHPLEHMQLSSMKDGVWADKTEKPIPWTSDPATSSVPSSPDIRSTASSSGASGSRSGAIASGT